MGTILVALTGETVDNRLLTAARRYAEGTDTEIVVCKFVDESDYQHDVREASRSGDQAPRAEDIETKARQQAEEAAESVFDGGVGFTPRGEVGHLPDVILDVADELSCDHLFITGRRRSPAGKVLFRDIAQSVILRFDGPVTVTVSESSD